MILRDRGVALLMVGALIIAALWLMGQAGWFGDPPHFPIHLEQLRRMGFIPSDTELMRNMSEYLETIPCSN